MQNKMFGVFYDAGYIGKAIDNAMRAIEAENDELKGVSPKNYATFENSLFVTLLKTFASIPINIEGAA